MTVKSYRDLEVYQRARKLILPVYQLAEQLPKDEKFDLRDQIRRACKSAVDNIVEGYSHKDTPTKPNHSGGSQWVRQMKWSSTWNKSFC